MSAETTRAEAMIRLGVTREQVYALPQITPHLRTTQMTIRGKGRVAPASPIDPIPDPYGPGTDLLTSWPLYLQASDSPDARKVLKVYYELPHYLRRALPIEAFCAAAGVSPLHILEQLTLVMVRQGASANAIIVAVNHPRITMKSVEMALTDDGFDDRELIHKAGGLLPMPKGATTIINNTPIASANASSQAEVKQLTVPAPEATIRRLSDRLHEIQLKEAEARKALPAADTMPSVIPIPDAELVSEAEDDV